MTTKNNDNGKEYNGTNTSITPSGQSVNAVKKKMDNNLLKKSIKKMLKPKNSKLTDSYSDLFHEYSCYPTALKNMGYCNRKIKKILKETEKEGITSEMAHRHGMFDITYYRNISSRHPIEGKENTEHGDHIWTNESMAEFLLKLIEAGTPNVLDKRKKKGTNCLILWLYPSKNKNIGHVVNVCRDKNGNLVVIDTSYYNIREYEKTLKRGVVYYKGSKAINYLKGYNQNIFGLITTKKLKYTKNFEIHRDRISDFTMGPSEEEMTLSEYFKILQKYGEKPYNLKEMFNPTINGIKPLKLVGRDSKLHKSWPEYIKQKFEASLGISLYERVFNLADKLSAQDLEELFNYNPTKMTIPTKEKGDNSKNSQIMQTLQSRRNSQDTPPPPTEANQQQETQATQETQSRRISQKTTRRSSQSTNSRTSKSRTSKSTTSKSRTSKSTTSKTAKKKH